uniref:C-type lectin domain-containing protein n=1 Tax=Branchiostoma floridae TaxID=7739 RepID=C3ZCI1_BRAFL|eukprot:XP_002593674.1 hypothetical protein BRAFLDRAFT_108089 [Branchiostoma floridae]
MYEQAQPVRSPFSRPDSGQTSGPPSQPPPVHQGSSHGRVRHGNGTSDKCPGDQETSTDTYEEAEAVKRHAAYKSADRTYAGGASGRRARCSFIRSHLSYMAAGIAVLLSLMGLGFAPLTFMNKKEISQLSTTVDALKRYQDDMVTTVDALARNQSDMSSTVDALKCDQDDMLTTVDALARNQNDVSATVDAWKRDQDDMSTTIDALKRDLDKERSRTAALEQRLHEISKTLLFCPEGYADFLGICYKAFNTEKTFSKAAAACREDGGTLAMPRDAETNVFLGSLYTSVSATSSYWIGLHDQREEGSFEWVDGSALGAYHFWESGQPNNSGGREDCVLYFSHWSLNLKGKWYDYRCDSVQRFICQAFPDKLNGPRDCMELLTTGHDTSGVYTIYPDGGGKSPVHVYCDMDTDGGGWTLFQKRQDGSVNFYRDWEEYKTGFGDLRGESWLGNDNLHRLTAQDVYELRVDLEDFEGNTAYAKYNIFRVEDEVHKYRLTVEGYSGTAGDAMTDPTRPHNGMYFSTRDRDNDIHLTGDCAEVYKGAWWHERCHRANLNGLYLGGAHQSFADGVNWSPWKGYEYSLKTTEMKIRPN